MTTEKQLETGKRQEINRNNQSNKRNRNPNDLNDRDT